MKKIILSIIFIYLYGITPKCGVFSNVLQTRDTPSHITMSGDGYIYNSPSCKINTTTIYQSNSAYPKLYCGSGVATTSGNLGKNLSINYTFLINQSNTNSKVTNDRTYKRVSSSTTLTKNEYKTIKISNYSSSYIDINIDAYKINNIKLTNNINIIFDTNNDLYIGSIGSKWGWNENNNLTLTHLINNLYIYDVYLKSNGNINFKTKNSIKIHNLEVGSNNSNIILKAPKIIIDNLTLKNTGSGGNVVNLYGDEIDISNLELKENTKLIIHHYSNDKNITFRSDTISTSSSSKIIVDSGDYYTNEFNIAGSNNVVPIKASDNSQIVNLFINNDFTPGNNPAINSDGNNGNFGSLNPSNFRIFINGDLETGDGGTTFNSLIYVEGDVKLGTSTYIKGGISANNEIKIKDNSKLYYDLNINSSGFGGTCGTNEYNFDNRYSCGIFPSVLTSFNSITTSSNKILNTCQISVNNSNYNETGSTTCDGCSCDSSNNVCNSDSTCNIVEEPKNNYSHNVLQTSKTDSNTKTNNFNFVDLEYGDYTFIKNNQTINFKPSKTYIDNSTNLMLLGDIKFTHNHQTLNFEGGDYYFKSFISNGDYLKICAKDDIRIFVKNNFELNGDNISTPCNGKIFIYTEGDVIIGNSSGGNNNIHLYLYSKNDINIDNNNNISNIYGALTSEGQINITGKVNFHYDTDGLDKFGLGTCDLCYDEHYLTTKGFSMFGMSMCTPMTPCEFDMPIKNTSDTQLNDVQIIETYQSGFTFAPTFFNFNKMDTIDKDGNHIGNGATKKTSSNYDNFDIFNPNALSTTSITYDFGDDYPTYNPSENYYRAYKKDTMSFSFNSGDINDWKDNVVYLAKFNKDGKQYNINISACPYVNNEHRPSGWLDAWDDYKASRGVNDRNISTKIVNQTFNITTAFIPNSEINANYASVKYYLIDLNSSTPHTPLSSKGELEIHNNNYTSKIKSFNISKAYKNVGVEFKVCANYYSSSGYRLYPFLNCSSVGDCSSNTEENRICYRYFTSTDNFSIRPKKFEIIGQGVVKADKNISFLNIKTLGFLNSVTQNYDENSTTIQLKPIDSLCNEDNLDYKFYFKNGLAYIEYLKYPEVGEIELNVSEIPNKEFAIVDKDDTDDKDRFITSVLSNKITIIPDHFKINIDKVSNFNNSNFTYLSNDLNMSGNLEFSIQAQNTNNVVTKNYDKNCYSKDITIQISHEANTSMENLNKIITQYSQNNKDNNISLTFDKNSFNEGNTSIKLLINFDRNFSKPTSAFDLKLKDISVTDKNNTFGTKNINQPLTFLYGNVFAKDIVTNQNETNLTIFYKYFDQTWQDNVYHNNKIYGDVNNSFSNEKISVNLNENNINKEQNISIKLNSSTKPYKAKIHLNIPSWLWYSKYNVPYQAPSIFNLNCLTHPCYNIVFTSTAKKLWAGVGTNEAENNTSINTINTNIKQNIQKNKNYQKINW